jgi:ABC-2 type transport system ATP-binding protein
MPDAIVLRGVTKRFNGTAAVEDLSLAVPAGSVYGFIGPNGSGKSTTLRMIMHILLPDEGDIEVLGSRGTAAARDRVSYLPEVRGVYMKLSGRRLLR